MRLLTNELEKRFKEIGSQEGLGFDARVVAKYFHPRSQWTWYATEYSQEDRLFFGYVEGFVGEWGYFSLDEMEEAKDQLGLGIERDLYWTEQPLRQALGMAPEGEVEEEGGSLGKQDREPRLNKAGGD